MSLREAIRLSNVPIYQNWPGGLAWRPWGAGGPPDYGNRDIGTQGPLLVDGPLQISAMEQVRFLARLAEGSRPSRGGPVRRCGTSSPGAGARLDIARETGWWNAPGPGLGCGWAGWTGRAVSSPLP